MRGLLRLRLPTLKEVRDVALDVATGRQSGMSGVGISIIRSICSEAEADAYLAEG